MSTTTIAFKQFIYPCKKNSNDCTITYKVHNLSFYFTSIWPCRFIFQKKNDVVKRVILGCRGICCVTILCLSERSTRKMYANNMKVAARLRWKGVNSFNFYHCLTFPSSFSFFWICTHKALSDVKKGQNFFFSGLLLQDRLGIMVLK